MADLAHQIFKLIILHNKLVSEKDLNFYLADTPDPTQCITRMVASNMFSQHVGDKLLEMYHKKLAKERKKRGISPPESPPEEDQAPVPLPDPDETSGHSSEKETGGPLELAIDHIDASDMNKADEVGWIDSSEHDDDQSVKHVNDEDRLEISDDFEVHTIVTSKNAGRLKSTKGPSLKAAKIASVKKTSQTEQTQETAPDLVDVEDRIPSSVSPGEIDPLALKILKKGVELGASDVHLSSSSPPFFRLHGSLVFTELPPLTPEQTMTMVLGFMDDEQQQHFLHTHDLDFSLDYPGIGRFRVNALQQFRGPSIIFRIIPSEVPTLKSLGLPDHLGDFTEYHQGLVLITGPAGCGKTTTAAALINLINTTRHDHVITVEDPVEFLQPSKNCNVTQRQVPNHTRSFSTALKAALREDPDVIMIGEMRDLETVSLAIRAAETGHLVIGTLQTKSAARTIDRIIDVFPEDQQAQIRAMLSESLRGIISQQLIPRKDGKGRAVALEVLNVVTAVSNLIRDSKTYQLPSLMQTGRKQGQIMMDDSLQTLLEQDLITKEQALKITDNPKRFK